MKFCHDEPTVCRVGIWYFLVLCLLTSFCGKTEKSDDWMNHVFAEGTGLFFQTVTTALDRHPDRGQLSDTEIAKIRTLDKQFPRTYGLLINMYYQKEEPIFRTLLEHGTEESRNLFRKQFLELAEFSARNFVRSLFLPGLHPDFIRNVQPRFKGKDRVDLILLSMGYFARLDEPEAESFANALSPEFDKQWGLDAANFRKAHRLSKGKGAKIAIIDSGIDTAHSIFKTTPFGEHFALVGRDGPPWRSGTPAVDWGWHGTIVSSIVARYSPEARITLYKGMDADTMNDAPYPLILAHFMAACIYKAVHDGNDIINISAGLGRDFPYVKDACQYAYDNNVLIVTASPYYLGKYLGNNYSFPGSYDSTISVTGIERNEDGGYGYWPVAAPEVTTTVGAPCAPFVAYPTYMEEQDDYAPGISCATPIVASAVALAVSEFPRTGMEKPGGYFEVIKKLLTDTSRPEACGFQGFTPECGYGLIDAEQMVLRARQLQRETPRGQE